MIRYSSHACYKSPIHKLVRFFEQSRDNWKEKYKTTKLTNKRLENKVRFLTKSRDAWKQETLAFRQVMKCHEKEKHKENDKPLKKH